MPNPRLTREESRQQTRTRLLEAAVQVFSRRGYQVATVDEIAEAAGYSKGAVYSNFSSKEELFLELLDQRFALERANWPGLADVIAPAHDPAPSQEDGYIEAIRTDRDWVILLMEFMLCALRDEKIWRMVQPRIHALQQDMQAALAGLYAERQLQPEIPVEMLPHAIISLGIGLSLQYFMDPPAFPDNMYGLVLHSILKGKHISDE
jgi:AcrR family transcriptional regulator